MTQDEIMRMAEQAGMFTHKEVQPEIQAFAKLVAAKEREACAKVCEQYTATGMIEEFDLGYLTAANNCAKAIRLMDAQ